MAQDKFDEALRDFKAAAAKLAEEMEARAARREHLRGVVSPEKLEEFDAATQKIEAALRDLKSALRSDTSQ
jgi:hypothetical protein